MPHARLDHSRARIAHARPAHAGRRACCRASRRALGTGSVTHRPGVNREAVGRWNRETTDSGTLFNEDYDDPVYRRMIEGLRVNSAKRPASEIAT
jgi:hypothetical protein